MNLFRCTLAFLLLTGIETALPGQQRTRGLTRQELKSLFGRALIGRVICSYLFIQACLFAPLGNVGWISALPTSALFGWWLFGQHVSRRDWLLLATGMIGVGMIVAPDLRIESVSGRGELYALLSTCATGFAALIGRTVVRERGAIFATRWVILFTALLATIAATIVEGGLKLPPIASLPMLLLVSVMVALGASCSLYGYTHLRASTATAILSLEAVWAVVIGIIFYQEHPTPPSLIGGVTIVAVAYLTSPKGNNSRGAKPSKQINNFSPLICTGVE